MRQSKKRGREVRVEYHLSEKEYDAVIEGLDTLRDHFKNNNILPLSRSECLQTAEACLEILDPGGKYRESL